MTDEELRALVREAVARHLAAHPEQSGGNPGADRLRQGCGGPPKSSTKAEAPGLLRPFRAGAGSDAVFHRYLLARGDDGDGACLIEPKVRCNHCGFCQSHGF